MRELLSLLPKPSRYLGIEEGSVRKDPAQVRLRVGLVFPDMYEVGMSYLGQKILYNIVNAHEQFYAERVFAPTEDVAAVLRAHGAPLATLESDTPLGSLDGVLFDKEKTALLCYPDGKDDAVYTVPDGVTVEVVDGTQIKVSGIDKQLVGQVSARIRSFRPPEPYKGKGVRYKDERVRRKAGKTVA